jgi:hypothetical protein
MASDKIKKLLEEATEAARDALERSKTLLSALIRDNKNNDFRQLISAGDTARCRLEQAVDHLTEVEDWIAEEEDGCPSVYPEQFEGLDDDDDDSSLSDR